MNRKVFYTIMFLGLGVSVSCFSQEGIGTDNPEKSAALEIRSERRGFLIPRIELIALNDFSPLVGNPTHALLVFNLTDNNELKQGYYFWSEPDSQWKKLLTEGEIFDGEIEEVWYDQDSHQPATSNEQDIYRQGSVSIGKTENFIDDVSLDVQGAIRGGNSNQDNIIGLNSFAVGNNLIAQGENSTAFGYGSKAIGEGSLAGGGYFYISTGLGTDEYRKGGQASGKSSLAFGYEAEAKGELSFAHGYKTLADSSYAIALGRETQALKTGSVAMGRETKADGSNAVALGRSTQAKGNYSFAMGRNNEVTGHNATASGRYLLANSSYLTVFGRGNVNFGASVSAWNEEDPLFVIGNGLNRSQTKNAMTVLKNGFVGIGLEGTGSNAKPKSRLDIGSGEVRIRDLPDSLGNINESNIVVVKTATSNHQKGILRSVPFSDIVVEPWMIQKTQQKAEENFENIYQMGSVAINHDRTLPQSTNNQPQENIKLYVKGSILSGEFNNTSQDIIGENALGIGNKVKPIGSNSIAFGWNTKANHYQSMAIGYSSEALGNGSFAGGGSRDGTSSGIRGGIASGKNAFAFGEKSKAEGDFSYAFGKETKAEKNYSFAFGINSEATGLNSFSFGRDNHSSASYSITMGRNNIADKPSSMVLGENLIANNSNETVLGKFNNENISNSFFQIGTGTASSRRTAFVILKEGETGIGINEAPTAQLDIGSLDGEGRVRIRELPHTPGLESDRVVMVDADGYLKSLENPGVFSVGNGLSLDINNPSKVILGGNLEENTILNLNGHSLKLEGLEQGNSAFDEVLLIDNQGIIKRGKSMLPKYFYLPAVLMPLSEEEETEYEFNYNNGIFIFDLYEVYLKQFSMTTNSVSSEGNGHIIPVLEAEELIYNITYFDASVYQEVSLNNQGQLQYQIISNAEPTSKTYMNIVFEVKD